MDKYTMRELKDLVNRGYAIDLTNCKDDKDLPEPTHQIGYACGIYGCNGILLKGCETHTLYAVIGRCGALYQYNR